MELRTCVVAEDGPSERFLYAKMLSDLGFDVIGLGANGKELIELSEKYNPDFILCDLEMPVVSGLDACRVIRNSQNSDSKIICITGVDIMPNAFEIAKWHINGYLLKGFNSRVLGTAIDSVFGGEFFIDHLLHKKISRLPEFETILQMPELTNVSNDPSSYVLIHYNGETVKVTDRHVLMVSALYYSKRKEEIAASLFIEPESVEQNLKRLKSRLNAKDKMELVRIFMEYGLIEKVEDKLSS